MRLRVEYQDGTIEFEAADDRVVAAFDGPPEPPAGDVRRRVRDALEAPIGYPPLRQVVVPGDRVVLPIDPALPDLPAVLGAVAEVLNEVGVASITAIPDPRVEAGPIPLIPGVDLVAHDPADREGLAYLATTESGRRIYLNRLVPDADCVIPIGRIAPDGPNECRGPWTVIEPGLSDATAPPASLLADGPATPTKESVEVSWLLGSMFQVGGISGRAGLLHLVCGETKAVRDRGSALLDESWRVDLEDRADLVVAGLGGPGRPATPADFVEGLRQALRSVRHGGKVALLSRLGLETIREALLGPLLPRGDWEKAQQWADIYLAAEAPADELDELGLIPLDRPEQAIKLAATAHSIATISQADRARVATAPVAGSSR